MKGAPLVTRGLLIVLVQLALLGWAMGRSTCAGTNAEHERPVCAARVGDSRLV